MFMVDNVMTWGKVQIFSPVSSDFFFKYQISPETKLMALLERNSLRFIQSLFRFFHDNCGSISGIGLVLH